MSASAPATRSMPSSTPARDHVPILLLAGRTPITEGDAHGARSLHIHWAQEMFDQASLVREFVKWDYELRTPDQAADAVARAMELMLAEPRGPAYLMLPREVLGGRSPTRHAAAGSARGAGGAAPRSRRHRDAGADDTQGRAPPGDRRRQRQDRGQRLPASPIWRSATRCRSSP